MKKRVFALISTFFLMIFCFPLIAFGAQYIEFDHVHAEITLNEDGSADIKETMDIYFGGGQITMYGLDFLENERISMSNWRVSMDGKPFKMLPAPDDSRPKGTFAVYHEGGKTLLDIYHKSNRILRTIEISYHVDGAVILHKDCAEFSWNLASGKEPADIKALTGSFIIPSGAKEKDFRIWAHGPLNGQIERENSRQAILAIEDLPGDKIVDIRFMMPLALFSGGYVSNEYAYDRIMAEEKVAADNANTLRQVTGDPEKEPTPETEVGSEPDLPENASIDYGNIDVYLQKDGMASISERYAYIAGQYSKPYFMRQYDAAQMANTENLTVSVNDTELIRLDAPVNNGLQGHYALVDDEDGLATLYVYMEGSNAGPVDVVVSYDISGITVFHEDVAEIRFQALNGSHYPDGWELCFVNIHYPEEFEQLHETMWGHHMGTGDYTPMFDRAEFTLSGIPAESARSDIRLLLPVEAFAPETTSGVMAANAIMAEESSLPEAGVGSYGQLPRSSYVQKKATTIENLLWDIELFFDYNGQMVLIVVGVIAAIIAIFLLIKKFGKRININIARQSSQNPPQNTQKENAGNKGKTLGGADRWLNKRFLPEQDPDYYRELPSSRTPAFVSRLYNFYGGKDTTSRMLTATLMHLHLKGVIKIDTEGSDALISALPYSETDLETHETALLEALKQATGGGKKSMKEIDVYFKNNAAAVQEQLNLFRKSIRMQIFEISTIIEKLVGYKRLKSFMALIRILLPIPFIIFLFTMPSGIIESIYRASNRLGFRHLLDYSMAYPLMYILQILICAGLLWLCWVIINRLFFKSYKVLTQEGENELAMWGAFGRFLDDFTLFDKKELPDFIVWREYLVYAVAMDKSKKLLKDLPLKYPEIKEDELYQRMIIDEEQFQRSFESFENAVDAEVRHRNRKEILERLKSMTSSDGHSSDSGGGGGGFSSSSGGSDSGRGGSRFN